MARTAFAKQQLQSFINRVERLEEERSALTADIREVYAEAKGCGFGPLLDRSGYALMESWRAIPGFDDLYEVSSRGRVRSRGRVSETMNRWGRMKRFFPGKVLRATPAAGGYLQVTLCDGTGGRDQRHVHNLVAEAFIGPRPTGQLVLHRDGIKLNCDLSNLRYGSPKDNSADAITHGTQVRGARQGSARLNEDQVRAIRATSGITNEGLAMRYGVSESTIASIRRGDSWRHVTPAYLTAMDMREGAPLLDYGEKVAAE